jgi:hypothetical protein
MNGSSKYPTPYVDVNELVDVLKCEVAGILRDRYIGMYIHGSLAIGDFDPHRSDIDFVVVTDDELSSESVSALEYMHAWIINSNLTWKTNFEGSYIPKDALRRLDPTNCTHPVIRVDGSFGLDRHSSEWVIQRHVIREYGIVVSGPDPRGIIDPVKPDQLREATLGVLCEWWAPQLEEPFRLCEDEYQAYTILTMCRVLYTLKFATVASKQIAARCMQKQLDRRWTALIDRALAWQHDKTMDSFVETMEFIRYTLENCMGERGKR